MLRRCSRVRREGPGVKSQQRRLAPRLVGCGLVLLAAQAVAATDAPSPSAPAAVSPVERRAMLEAIRPAAARRAGQPVKFKVERLNVDGGWALLTGELVSARGGPLDWRRASECHVELDKLLWVVLARRAGRWQVRHLEVCATEPPHWALEPYGGLVWPCGVYAGLQGPTGEDLEAACRRERAARETAPR